MSLHVSEKQTTQFERGFKTWSERTAVGTRKSLGLKDIDPIDPKKLAEHLGVRLWDLCSIPGVAEEALRHLTSPEGDEWSAVTVSLGQSDVMVINPTHSPARQNSDVTHELAHIIRQHTPAQHFISQETGIVLRTYNAVQESEANWLAGCLLLPRTALAYHVYRKTSRDDLCEHFGVSKDLLLYRINVTGLRQQFACV